MVSAAPRAQRLCNLPLLWMAEKAAAAREEMLAAVADHDEDILHHVVDGSDVSEETIKKAIRSAVLDASIVPVLCGAAFRNKGVQRLLDAVVDYLPDPTDVPPVKGLNPFSFPRSCVGMHTSLRAATLAHGNQR